MVLEILKDCNVKNSPIFQLRDNRRGSFNVNIFFLLISEGFVAFAYVEVF